MEIFTLTLTLSLKGEGMIELRKSYLIQTNNRKAFPPGYALTLTLSRRERELL